MINKAEKVPIKVVHVWMATWSRCFIIIGRPAHDSRSHLHPTIRRPFNQLIKCSVEDDLCPFPLSSTLPNILNVQFLQAIPQLEYNESSKCSRRYTIRQYSRVTSQKDNNTWFQYISGVSSYKYDLKDF